MAARIARKQDSRSAGGRHSQVRSALNRRSRPCLWHLCSCRRPARALGTAEACAGADGAIGAEETPPEGGDAAATRFCPRHASCDEFTRERAPGASTGGNSLPDRCDRRGSGRGHVRARKAGAALGPRSLHPCFRSTTSAPAAAIASRKGAAPRDSFSPLAPDGQKPSLAR